MGGLLVVAPGCVAFNTECTPPIDEPEQVVAYLHEAVPISRAVVRRQESALGGAMADAYMAALADFSPRPVLALENAGAIRDAGLCTTREQLPRGAVDRRVLRDVVPFSNELVVVELTYAELFNVLEHGVATLTDASPSGQFLQVSDELAYEVDCARTPEVLRNAGGQLVREQSGNRVRVIHHAGRSITRDNAFAFDDRVPVAVNEFIAAGGDNFLDFVGKTPVRTGLYTYAVFEEHLTSLGPSVSSAARLFVDPQNPRIALANCR